MVRIPAIGVLRGSVVFTPKPSGTDTARPADCSQGRHSSLRSGIRSQAWARAAIHTRLNRREMTAAGGVKATAARHRSNSIGGASVRHQKGWSEVNPYAIVGSGSGTAEAASLQARLTAWHDAMVAHERRLRLGHTTDVCDEDCPHVEARTLWAEVSAMLGSRADELTFLRSRALNTSASSNQLAAAAKTVSQQADSPRLSRTARTASEQRLSRSSIDLADRSRMARAEV